MAVQELFNDLTRGRFLRFPQGLDVHGLLRLQPEDIEYRFRSRDTFEYLPKVTSIFELTDTNLASLEASAEIAIRANQNWMIAGTNATSALVTYSTTGGIKLTSAGASADEIILTPQTESGFVGRLATIDWRNDLQPSIAAVFRRQIGTGTGEEEDTDFKITVGFSDAVDTDAADATNDAVLFTLQSSGVSSSAVGTLTGILTTTLAGVDATTNLPTSFTWTRGSSMLIEIVVDSARRPTLYINGQEFVRSTVQLAANPAGSYFPIVGIKQVEALVTTAPAIILRGVEVGQNYA